MGVTKEQWNYSGGERVWVGKYKNSQNIMHWHSDCELICVETGELDVTVGHASYRLRQGDAMFIDAEALHRISAVSPDTLLVTVIFDGKIISDFAENVELSSPVLSRDYDLQNVYALLLSELTGKKNLYTFATTASVYKLMLDIFRREPTVQRKPRGKTDSKLKSLFEQIHENYDTYTLGEAARFMGMSASYLSRFFTERTGMHFMRYLNCVRVENAVALLESDEYSVTEVANRCGFDTIRNFNRIFKILTGYSPTGLPHDYVFSATTGAVGTKSADPTLYGCELVECSSRR